MGIKSLQSIELVVSLVTLLSVIVGGYWAVFRAGRIHGTLTERLGHLETQLGLLRQENGSQHAEVQKRLDTHGEAVTRIETKLDMHLHQHRDERRGGHGG